MGNTKDNRQDSKIFISHSSHDKPFGNALVNLLLRIGFDKTQIVYTGRHDTGIPFNNDDIFAYLKSQISDNAYMLYLLSDNYFNSIACLNEMGAAWIRQNNSSLLLVPGFSADDERILRSVVNARKLMQRLDHWSTMMRFAAGIAEEFGISVRSETLNDACEEYFEELERVMQFQSVDYQIKLAQMERQLRQAPQDPELLTLRAFYMYDIDHGNYPLSIQTLLYAIYLDPDCFAPYDRLVQMAVRNNDTTRALDWAEKTCRRFPDTAKAYACRAFAKNRVKQSDSAIEDATCAIDMSRGKEDPDTWWYYNIRGCAYQDKKDFQSAIFDLWTAYDKNTGTDGTNRTKIYLKSLSLQVGLDNMCRTADTWKEHGKALKQGYPGKAKENFEKARTYFKCVLMTDPKNKKALLYYGWLHYDLMEWKEALAMWEKLVALEERDYYYWLCADVCPYTPRAEMQPTFCRRGLACPDTGYHDKLRKMLQLLEGAGAV